MYSLEDLYYSDKIKINKNNRIILIVDTKDKYLSFSQNLIRNILISHDVNITILTLEKYIYVLKNQIFAQLLEEYPDNIQIESIKFSLEDNLFRNGFDLGSIPIQYIKPFALYYIFNYMISNNNNISNILYLDVDTFVLRRLDRLFDSIDTQPLIVRELGIDLQKVKLSDLLNKPDIYKFFDSIAIDRRWISKPPPNTGVLGFNLLRDFDLVKEWYNVTKFCLNNGLKSLIAWWDQGTFVLALEKLNLQHLVIDNLVYHKTLLLENSAISNNLNLSAQPSSVIHFIGTNKYNPISCINEKPKLKNKTDILLSILYRNNDPLYDIHPRSYLNFINIDKLAPLPGYEKYFLPQLDIFKIYLAKHNILDTNTNIIGCIPRSWSTKYASYPLDHLYNWSRNNLISKIQLDTNIILCGSICCGIYSSPQDPLWKQNFQKHFREEFPNSEHIQDQLQNITGLSYDGLTSCPYGNEIICHRDKFIELQDFNKEYIPKIIDYFGDRPEYNVPDKDIALAYIIEELILLWWANQKGCYFVSCSS